MEFLFFHNHFSFRELPFFIDSPPEGTWKNTCIFVFPFGQGIIVFARFYKLILHFGGPFGPPPFGLPEHYFYFSFISLSQREGTYTLAPIHPENDYFYFFFYHRSAAGRYIKKRSFRIIFSFRSIFLLSPIRRRKVHGRIHVFFLFYLLDQKS